MNTDKVMSEEFDVAAAAIDQAIKNNNSKESRQFADVANNYYESKHDIMNFRIFYLDDNNSLKEDKYASNVKIPHSFFTELVDQKVNYLLSTPVRFLAAADQEKLQKELDNYTDEEFQLFVSELLEDASISGASYAYSRTNAQDKVCFQVSRFLKTFSVYNDLYDEVAIIRHYTKDILLNDKVKTVLFAERWDDKQVTFFKTDKNDKLVFDKDREMNPRPHVVAETKDGTPLSRAYEQIPFYKLANNRNELSDLSPIKALIDDYDLMACFLSNNLMDYDKPIYVVSGFQGDDLDKLRQNIKAKGVVNVGSPSMGGDVNLRTFQIPFEARQAKLEIDKEAIYKFGMGFDSSQTGDGNITNIVIKMRYTLLEMKCRKVEFRLRSLLKWCLEMIIKDINRKSGTQYTSEGIEIEIEPETLVNESDIVNDEKVLAETKQTLIAAIVASAPYLADDNLIGLICKQWDLDTEEVKKAIEDDTEEIISDHK